MPFTMTKELNAIFQTCSESSLSPKETHLVTLAAQLAVRRDVPGAATLELARSVGATLEELNRVGCMCACTVGPSVQDRFVKLLQPLSGAGGAELPGRLGVPAALAPPAAGPLPLPAPTALERIAEAGHNLDTSIFRAFRLCTTQSLDKKTNHLVGLASCLATGCACAAGHIIEARNAGATDEELARCACIAACASGLRTKYTFLEAMDRLQNCASPNACVC
jgi:AhpD family alkylhydroperoxidase